MAGGSYESFADGTMEGHVHAGLAARAGIIAAALAGAGGETSGGTLDGADGFFHTYARGRIWDAGALTAETRGLGILSAWSKPFPACKGNQETMRLIRTLQPAGFAPSEIKRVIVTRRQNDYGTGILAAPPYTNMLQAQISARFTSVAALLGKPVAELRYPRTSFDQDVEEIVRKTSLLVAEREGDRITVDVVLKGGATVTMRSVDVADMSWDTDREARFERLASPRLHDATRSVLDVVASLGCAPDIGGLMQLVRA